MISSIFFDLDGCLISTKDLHYKSLNLSLASLVGYEIPYEEHLAEYDGLSTTLKLKKLTELVGLSPDLYNDIWRLKQEYTFDLLKDIKVLPNVVETLKHLSKKYKIYCCSNSIRKTVRLSLFYTGLLEWIDDYFSNEDCVAPKPNCSIYSTVVAKFGLKPSEVLIVEDSPIGREAAFNSRCNVMEVESLEDITIENVEKRISELTEQKVKPKWIDKKLTVVIPMSGDGSRFKDAGYVFPKPLIEIHGRPMIKVVTDNLNIDANYIFIIRKEHNDKYNVAQMLNVIKPGCKVIQVDSLTEGASCTVLLSKEYINNDNPVLVANSDQFVEWDSNKFLYSSQNVDGSLLTFKSVHPKWSYVKKDESGFVTEVKEKQVISDTATVGIYFWKRGSDLVNSIEEMISVNDRFNNEFYLAPTYNYLINKGKKIKTFDVEEKSVWGLGTPTDMEYFLSNYKGPI